MSGSYLTSHNGGLPEGYDITTKGVLVASRTDRRRFWVAVNASDTPLYLAFRDAADNNGECPAEAGKGIYLAPNGGAAELNNTNMYYGEIWAIHGGSGSKRLCVQPGR
jgi:hypothetical protein